MSASVVSDPPAAPPPRRTGARARIEAPPARPRWARPALGAVLVLAAVLFCWDVWRNGTSNEYYAAAVKSASLDWKAWFFGSLDPGSFITVDKPPLSIWLMGLSTRIFGFSSAAMLLPEGLCMLGAVALLNGTVRRAFGPAAGIAAALALALTPTVVAIARVNNPDALLILLLVASAYATVRALEAGRFRWLALAGVAVGLAFMTKMLQGWMVLPALGAAYALAAPVPVRRRIAQLAGAGAITVVVSAAWPTAVSLWPGTKPYIGGSTDGSAWDLILGYNGLGRIFGEGGGMGGGGASFGGTAGALRLFNDQVGGQVAWLLPLALVGLVVGLWTTRRAPRTDLRRAIVVLLGLWAIVHVAIFSFAEGTFHPYYTSALAPAVAGLAAIGVLELWPPARRSWAAFGVLAASVLGTAALAIVLLSRTADHVGWLRMFIGVAAVLAVLVGLAARTEGRGVRRLAATAAVAGTVALLAGPASYAVANLGRSLDGNNVLAGPASVSQAGGGMGGPGGGGFRGGPGGSSGSGSGTRPTGTPPAGASGRRAGGGAPTGGGGMGGSVSSSLISYLQAHQGSAKYLVAVFGSQTAAPIILQTGEPVVAIGGFGGSDAAPSVTELAQMVSSGQLKYVLVSSGGGMGGGRGGSSQSALTTWIEAHGTAVSGVGTTSGTLYALSA